MAFVIKYTTTDNQITTTILSPVRHTFNDGVGTMVFNDAVTSIGSGCFGSNVKTIAFANGLETISAYAFEKLTSLETVYFPSTIKTLGAHCFNSTKLTKIICYATTAPTIYYFNVVGSTGVLYHPDGSDYSSFFNTRIALPSGWTEASTSDIEAPDLSVTKNTPTLEVTTDIKENYVTVTATTDSDGTITLYVDGTLNTTLESGVAKNIELPIGNHTLYVTVSETETYKPITSENYAVNILHAANLRYVSCKYDNGIYTFTIESDSDGAVSLYADGVLKSTVTEVYGSATLTLDTSNNSYNTVQFKQSPTDYYRAEETNEITFTKLTIGEPEVIVKNEIYTIKVPFTTTSVQQINVYVNGDYVTQTWETDSNGNKYFVYNTKYKGTYSIKGVIEGTESETGFETSEVTATIPKSIWSPAINKIENGEVIFSHSNYRQIHIASTVLDLSKIKVKVYNGSGDITNYTISYIDSSSYYVQIYIPDASSIYYTIEYEGDDNFLPYFYRSEEYSVTDSDYELPTWKISPANKETGTNVYTQNSLVSFAATMSDPSAKIYYNLQRDGSLDNLLPSDKRTGEYGQEITYVFTEKGKHILFASLLDTYGEYPDNTIAYIFNVVDPVYYDFEWDVRKTTLDTNYIKVNYSVTVPGHQIERYVFKVDDNVISGITDNSYIAEDHCQISITAYALDGVPTTYPTFDPFEGLVLSTMAFRKSNIKVGKKEATGLTSLVFFGKELFKPDITISDLETDVDWIHLDKINYEKTGTHTNISTGHVTFIWNYVLYFNVDAYDGNTHRVGHIQQKGKYATDNNRITVTQHADAVVTIKPDSFSVNYEAQTVTSKISASNAFDITVQSNNDWIEATLSGDTITYNIAKNPSFKNNRSGSVTVSYKDELDVSHTIDITIQQTYNDTCSLEFNSDLYNVGYNSGSFNAVATCHHVKNITNVSIASSWVTLSSPTDLPLSVNDNDKVTFVFNYNDNEYASRTTNITFTFTDANDESHTATIKVKQPEVPGSTITIVPDTHTVSANKSQVVTSTVNAKNTTDLTCSSDSNWAVPTLSGNNISVAVAKDDSNVTRQAIIQVSGKNALGNTVSSSLKIIQKVKAKTNIRISTEGELKLENTIKIKVESNNKTSKFTVNVDGTSIGDCKSGEYIEYKLTKAGDVLINVFCVESDTYLAVSENLTINVDKLESTLSLTITGVKKTHNRLSIIATSNNQKGAISIYANDVKLGTTTSGKGIAWTPTTAGIYTIKAEITETTNYNSATLIKTVNIVDRDIILFTVTGTFQQYKPLTITLDTLTDGIVYFSDGENLIGACSDKKTVMYTPTKTGNITISAKCYETEYWDADTEAQTHNIAPTILPPSSGGTETPDYPGTSDGAVFANGTIITDVSGSTIEYGYGVLPNVYFTKEFDTNVGNYGIDLEFEVTGNNCKIIEGDSFGVSCHNGVFTIRCKSQTIETKLEPDTIAKISMHVFANNGYTKIFVNGTEYKQDGIISYADNESINIYGSTLNNTIHYVNVVNTRCRPVLNRHSYEFCTVNGEFAIYDQFDGTYMKSSQDGCTLKSK